MEPFLAQIMLFGGNFTIRGWAQCDGTLLSIAQNSALFSLLGTTYGGNGQTTFALPDLRGRVAIGQGQAVGGSNYTLGEAAGFEQVTLTVQQMPIHHHALMTKNATSSTDVPGSTVVLAKGPTFGSGPTAQIGNIYSTEAPDTMLSPNSISAAGGNLPFSVKQPYLVLNYQIALNGVFPSRN